MRFLRLKDLQSIWGNREKQRGIPKDNTSVQFSSVQSLSRVWLFATQLTAACQASISITNFWSLLKLMSIESVAIQQSHPLSSPCPPAFNLSQHQGLSKWVSSSHRWPKYWNFSFSISPSNEYSELISSKGLSKVFSNTMVQKHQFFSAQLSLRCNSHIHIWLLEKPQPWLDGTLLAK